MTRSRAVENVLQQGANTQNQNQVVNSIDLTLVRRSARSQHDTNTRFRNEVVNNSIDPTPIRRSVRKVEKICYKKYF